MHRIVTALATVLLFSSLTACAADEGSSDPVAGQSAESREPAPNPTPEKEERSDSAETPTAAPIPTPTLTSCAAKNACASATDIGSIGGDTTVAEKALVATGTTGTWLTFKVTEKDGSLSGHKMNVSATLTAPAGWTFVARMDTQSGSTAVCGARTYLTTTNKLDLEWGEDFRPNVTDDTRQVVVEIRPAATCSPDAPWTFKVEHKTGS
jgi:hypothetical protein